MATVRPISPQYQQTLDSAISLAKELASKNMADSGDSSPKTPNSPDKKRFNFKLKYFSKSFSEASANIRDIESSISYEAKQAYKSLVERGPFNSAYSSAGLPFGSSRHHQSYNHHHHHQTLGSSGGASTSGSSCSSPRAFNQQHHYANDDFCGSDFGPTPPAATMKPSRSSSAKHARAYSTFSVKKSFF